MESLAPLWETWAQERLWRVPYSFRINPPRKKKASQTCVKPFCVEKNIPQGRHSVLPLILPLAVMLFIFHFPVH